MRALVYVVASLAAVGIMIGIIRMPDPVDQPSASSAPVVPVARVMDEPGVLTLSVPTMSCEIACYPTVKKVLEESDAVEAVKLDVQKEEGTIDNRQVVVMYDTGFDVDAAIASLANEGFADSDIVQ